MIRINDISTRVLFLLLMIMISHRAYPQEDKNDYIIGTGDLISIKFWQKPEFNTEARVNAVGEIQLPLIGTLQVMGLTTTQLRDNIEDRISLLDSNVNQVTVLILAYGSKSVYVTGAVKTPGKISFEVIPNLWQIIMEAGGPLPTAQLDEVTVVRGGGTEAGKIIHVDMTDVLEKGKLSLLPPVYTGDTIHITGSIIQGSTSILPSPLERRDWVYVFGEVAKPGAYGTDKNIDVLDALILAGGPTERANLAKVKLLFRGRRHGELAVVDIKRYVEKSIPLPLDVFPGDAIYVPAKRRYAIMGEVIRGFVYIATSYLIYSLN
jgi:polysaccharide export outer membrane protein